MLYDRPVRLLLRDAVNAMPANFTALDVVAWFAARYPKVKATTVRAHVMAATVNHASRTHYPDIGDLLFRQPGRRLERYDPSRHGWWRGGQLVTPASEQPLDAAQEGEAQPSLPPVDGPREEAASLSGYFGTPLEPKVVELAGGVTHRFDLVSSDTSVIGSILYGAPAPTAEDGWAAITQEIWLLQKVAKPATKFLAIKDERVARLWLSHFAALAQDVVFLGVEQGSVVDLRNEE